MPLFATPPNFMTFRSKGSFPYKLQKFEYFPMYSMAECGLENKGCHATIEA